MSSIFLSHNHADKPFVRRLAQDLQAAGVRVWLDEAEMMIGDSLIEKIRQGIDEMDYLGVVLSPHSAQSEWVKREVDLAMNQEIEGKRVKVLPLLIEDCEFPGFLKGKLYADFRAAERYKETLSEVLRRLGISNRAHQPTPLVAASQRDTLHERVWWRWIFSPRWKTKRQQQALNAALELERIARLRMEGELQAARDIQMGMLPAPWSITGFPNTIEFHALLEPAEEIGGDFYDAFMLDDHRLFFLVGDVSGKGVPAGLYMPLTKTYLKNAAKRQHESLGALVQVANRELFDGNPAALFVTAIMGIIDARTGEVELCSAGHEAPILLRTGEKPRALTLTVGSPLYVLEDSPYASTHIRLQPNDILLLITDGITEAQDAQQNVYGLSRVLKYLTAMESESSRAVSVCQGLYDDLRRFVRDAPPSDDVTIMALRFTAVASASS